MHWTDAVKSSSIHTAVRQDHIGLGYGRLMIRHPDGSGKVELMPSARRQLTIPVFRPASPHEIEGFEDWFPAQTETDCKDRLGLKTELSRDEM